MRSASAACSGVLILKNGSTGVAAQAAIPSGYRALHSLTWRRPSRVSARRKSSRNSTGQIATTGCGRFAELAQAIRALARDFYTAFYRLTPTAAQIDRVLGGGA